jgi:hypothetical protein
VKFLQATRQKLPQLLGLAVSTLEQRTTIARLNDGGRFWMSSGLARSGRTLPFCVGRGCSGSAYVGLPSALRTTGAGICGGLFVPRA